MKTQFWIISVLMLLVLSVGATAEITVREWCEFCDENVEGQDICYQVCYDAGVVRPDVYTIGRDPSIAAHGDGPGIYRIKQRLDAFYGYYDAVFLKNLPYTTRVIERGDYIYPPYVVTENGAIADNVKVYVATNTPSQEARYEVRESSHGIDDVKEDAEEYEARGANTYYGEDFSSNFFTNAGSSLFALVLVIVLLVVIIVALYKLFLKKEDA